MTKPAIKVEGLYKEYVVGHAQQQHGTFYDLLTSGLKAPFKRLRSLGGKTEEKERFWALKDVNFEVQPGEVIGIIGRNGAGKSTLLKILSRITAPTKGRIEVRGRMASLLEVGTGFHPELSGRENIYLNGAILGMSRNEVTSKFDEIVAFAEIEKFIDTPVKRYSSGMYVRLAFAVAAHLETDVLLVDEVLAVGDAAFQRKSLGKMSDVASGGKTVIFVSHNLGAVRNLCKKSLILERGEGVFSGNVEEGLAFYERSFNSTRSDIADINFHGALSDRLRFSGLICIQDGVAVQVIDPLSPFYIELHGESDESFDCLDLKMSFFRDSILIGSSHDTPYGMPMKAGTFVSKFDVPGNVFRPGRYTLGVGASASIGSWTWGSDVAIIEISQNYGGRSPERSEGVLSIPINGQRFQNGSSE
jgi:lipopolysaccharide transport system ATP-binding protein